MKVFSFLPNLKATFTLKKDVKMTANKSKPEIKEFHMG